MSLATWLARIAYALPQVSSRSLLVRTSANSLDLRGERVDAALARADKFVDELLRAGQDAGYLIHGHGTGALRNALREHLAASPGVESIRPGEPGEGGDGVTVVTLL